MVYDPFISHSRKGKTVEIEYRSVIAMGQELGKRTWLPRDGQTFWSNGSVLYLMCGMITYYKY